MPSGSSGRFLFIITFLLKRTLAIIFSILVILSSGIGGAAALWKRLSSPYGFYVNNTQVVTFTGALCTGLVFFLYHLYFLMTLKRILKKTDNISSSSLAKVFTWTFVLSIFVWFLIWLFGSYLTFFEDPENFNVNIFTWLIVTIFLFMNCFVGIFFYKLRKKYAIDSMNDQIDHLGEKFDR